jgi:alanyl-tRNA synthetase
MTSSEIRAKFLDYFESKDHRVVKSSSLLPKDDPTLLFTNAGMVQFKRVFLGEEKRDYVRAASAQKCVRAGGKHNDLENVGYTARHHTFFEMLGNFSFGDYFKKQAIDYGWELLTRVYGLPQERLYVSVYVDDDEAYTIWNKDVGLPQTRIIRMGEKDNFWAMGDTGPCGPCSEILFDQGEGVGCGRPECAPGCDCDRYLELWNLVFMQFNRDETGSMTPLPKPSIDTGMGLERITAVLQGRKSNYDTDLFQGTIQKISHMTGKTYGMDSKSDLSFRVVADHIRSITFLIADGIFPSNEGRGYVLRRILRRALRYGKALGLDEPFLHGLVGSVVDNMKGAYPELAGSYELISKIVYSEEERFLNTLQNGLNLLYGEIERLRAGNVHELPGGLAFKLYDTYGFPLDILFDVGREEGLTVDEAGFNRAMEHQREQSRRSWKGSGEQEIPEVYRELLSQGIKTVFEGYEQQKIQAKVLAIVREGKGGSSMLQAGHTGEVVLDRTTLYGQAGGQVGDKGIIRGKTGMMEVNNTLKYGGDLIVHLGIVKEGTLNLGETVEVYYDNELRQSTARNHTATHLLHNALRTILGGHVKQAGSLVAPDRLRFDFTHFESVDEQTLIQVEDYVNRAIVNNSELTTSVMDMEEAVKKGAIALFEERYGDRVRMVSIADFSRELCGGTHTHRTGDVGLFKIISESSVAAGIRRIEALTGLGALAYLREKHRQLRQIGEIIKAGVEEVPERIEKILARLRYLERELSELKQKETVGNLDQVMSQIREVNGVPLLTAVVSADNPKELRELGDRVRDRLKSGIVVLGSESEDKALLLAMVSQDLASRFPAGKIVGEAIKKVGGRGGGSPHMAQAGGPDKANLKQALERVVQIIEDL